MKTYKHTEKSNLYSLVIPFPNLGNESGEELFDDCPTCQLLKKQIETGEVVPSFIDEEDEH